MGEGEVGADMSANKGVPTMRVDYRYAFYDYLRGEFPPACMSPTFWDVLRVVRGAT